MLNRRNLLKMAVYTTVLRTSRIAFCIPNALNEQRFIRVGGIDQWISIEGDDVKNPVILFLHGGPAEAQSPFLKEFHSWKRAFTVINWDQRGSGKTYGRNGPATPDMTVERMAKDAVEIAEYGCRRLNKFKLILIGHSWGALLGLHVLRLRPELFNAFVSTGQLVSWERSLQAAEQWTRKNAAAERDEETLKILAETANLPVNDMKRIMASRKWSMSPSDTEYLKIQSAFVGLPPFSEKGDVADWIAGGTFSMAKLAPAIFSFDARTLGLKLPIPFFVIQGRDDHVVSFDDARAYVKEVDAPKKGFVPISGGHYACFTNPRGFVDALLKHVLPVVGNGD